MTNYLDPQSIYDEWIKVRDILIERKIQAAERHDIKGSVDMDLAIRMRWEVFVKDLEMATMFKYLEIKI